MRPLKGWSVIGAKTAVIVLATWVTYNQDLTLIANEAFRSELMSHILALPFLFTYLIYRKKKILRATIPLEPPTAKTKIINEGAGALLCLIAFLLYWHGSYTFNPLEYHMISLPIFTVGLLLAMFNLETLRVLAFPIALLLLMVPLPLEFVNQAGTTLSATSSVMAYSALKGLGLPVTLESQYLVPVIVLTKPEASPLSFAVDIACSDIYELTGFTVFALFISYITRGALWKKAAVFATGFPLVYALNILRIVTIVLIGAQSGIETAMQIFHLFGGWFLILIGSVIFLSISEKLLRIRLLGKKMNPKPCDYCNQKPEREHYFCFACGRPLNPVELNWSKRDLTKVAILAAVALLIVNIQAPVFALTEGAAEVNIRTLGSEQATAQILPEIPDYETRFVYRDRRFEELAKQDGALIYAYIPSLKSAEKIWVSLEIAKTRSSLHRWEVCLITWPQTHGYQPRVTQLALRDAQILDNPPLTARLFAFQDRDSGVSQVVLYWFENAYFNTGYAVEEEHVKISLIAFANKPEDISHIENLLLSLAKPIVNYWQPIKTWSQISLLLSQNGMTLLAATAASILALSTYTLTGTRLRKRSNRKIYDKLAIEEERLIVNAVHLSGKENATASKIAQEYERLGGKPIGLDQLVRKLGRAREAGLVKQEIASVEDEPILTWKTDLL